jgi:hypothetical protein
MVVKPKHSSAPQSLAPPPAQIWTQRPELQNRHSSAWWFFLLLPEQPEGFGPKQMMFTLASRVGDEICVNGVWQPGLDRKRPLGPTEEQFNTLAFGWLHDGKQMHENIVYQPIMATLSKQGYVGGWANDHGRKRYGAEIRPGDAGPFSLEATFEGARGYGRFTTWGDERAQATSPIEAIDLKTPLGGANMIAWRRLNFRGEFCSPGGVEQLQGIGYFQRVSLNFPGFPWKWIWAAFQDQSIFSGFVPYLGLQLFRQGDWFFSPSVETKTVGIIPGAFFVWGDSLEMVRFNRVRVTPHVRRDAYPAFMVECRSAAGDFIRYRIESYGHAQLKLERRVLRGLLRSGFNYNEYMFRVQDLSGVVGGRDLTKANLGNGFGNIEYTWGLGL